MSITDALKKRVLFLQHNRVPDGDGGALDSFSPIGSRFCAIWQRGNTREGFYAARRATQTSLTLVLRYDSFSKALTNRDRAQLDETTFEIVGISRGTPADPMSRAMISLYLETVS